MDDNFRPLHIKQMNMVTKVSDLLSIGTITFVPLTFNRDHTFSDFFLVEIDDNFLPFHIKRMNMVK